MRQPKRIFIGAALSLTALAALVGSAGTAFADATFHTERISLLPVGGAPLQSGFVVDIHANGPQNYALERYQLDGAAPNTSYQVQSLVFLNTTCSGAPALVAPDATLETNASGNGEAGHQIPPSFIPPALHGATVTIIWQVLKGGTVAYQTGCVTVALD